MTEKEQEIYKKGFADGYEARRQETVTAALEILTDLHEKLIRRTDALQPKAR